MEKANQLYMLKGLETNVINWGHDYRKFGPACVMIKIYQHIRDMAYQLFRDAKRVGSGVDGLQDEDWLFKSKEDFFEDHLRQFYDCYKTLELNYNKSLVKVLSEKTYNNNKNLAPNKRSPEFRFYTHLSEEFFFTTFVTGDKDEEYFPEGPLREGVKYFKTKRFEN